MFNAKVSPFRSFRFKFSLRWETSYQTGCPRLLQSQAARATRQDGLAFFASWFVCLRTRKTGGDGNQRASLAADCGAQHEVVLADCVCGLHRSQRRRDHRANLSARVLLVLVRDAAPDGHDWECARQLHEW